MIAEIISVGTELLLGDILNTNAQYLARELAAMGITVYYQTVVGDNEQRLIMAYKKAFERADIVITSGGLGPTEDDLTKESGAKFFNKQLILHDDILDGIKAFFNKINIPITENNIKQAYFPKNSVILKNPNGTAAGCLIEENNKMLFMLPGPPNEFIPMFYNEVRPILIQKTDDVFYSNVLRVCGIGESSLEDFIKQILDNQTNPTIALYAKDYEVHLRITAKAKSIDAAKQLISPVKEQLYNMLGDNIYGEDDNSLEDIIVKHLIKNNKTLSIAESCTGGMVCSAIVNVAGSSDVFFEGAITYENSAKIKRLGVKNETLDKYGAVSKQTAMEMAEGIAKTSGTNIGLSTTGIAGPGGGTDDKPVGLIYIGLYIDGVSSYKAINLRGNRQKIRTRATTNALDFLRRNI